MVRREFTISSDFFGDEEDRKYAGKYVLERMSGWERMQIDKQCRTINVEDNSVEFDDDKWSLMILEKSLKQPKLSLEELKSMHPGLLDFLIEQAVSLNSISKAKRDFLSSQLSISKEPSRP